MTDARRPAATGHPERIVLDDPDAVSAAAAERIATALRHAVEQRGRADWATTGGSAALPIYRALAEPPVRDAVPWQDVHLWWGDDRYVPRDHPQSNVMPADQALISTSALSGQSGWGEDARDVRAGRDPGAPIPVPNIHPIRAAEAIGNGGGPGWAAERYEEELRTSGIEVVDGWPVFDLLVLGVGPDGHLLSVFPGSASLDDEQAWALPVPAPNHVEPHIARITLNPRVIAVARTVLVVTHGAGKAEILGAIFGPERDPHRWPAQLALRDGATWLLDRAAAARLPQDSP